MTGDKTLSGGILLTAAQSMQGFSVDMRLREQANKESAETGFAQDGSSKTMQQAPAADNPDDAGTGC